MQMPRDGAYLAARAVFDRDDVHSRVGAIAAPTLVVAGRRDQMTPWKAGQAVASLVPGASFVTLDCGHAMTTEAPGPVTAALHRHLAAGGR